MRFLLRVHKCGNILCRYYDVSMGNACTCDNCMNCMIFAFKEVSAYDLIDYLLCNSYMIHYLIKCANGKCDETDCNVQGWPKQFHQN